MHKRKIEKAVIVCFAGLGLLVLGGGCATRGAPMDVSGKVIYAGSQTGTIRLTFKGPVAPQTLTFLVDDQWKGSFSYHLIVLQGTYSLSAYLDTNRDNKQQPDEPSGSFDANGDARPDKLLATGKVIADVTLTDR
jgi:hypothetical protein